MSKTHMTEAEIEALTELANANPEKFRLVYGVSGLVTCDGYALELLENGYLKGVIHPKAAIDILMEQTS